MEERTKTKERAEMKEGYATVELCGTVSEDERAFDKCTCVNVRAGDAWVQVRAYWDDKIDMPRKMLKGDDIRVVGDLCTYKSKEGDKRVFVKAKSIASV